MKKRMCGCVTACVLTWMVHGGHLSIPVSQGFFQHLPQKDPIFSAEVLQRKRGDAA